MISYYRKHNVDICWQNKYNFCRILIRWTYKELNSGNFMVIVLICQFAITNPPHAVWFFLTIQTYIYHLRMRVGNIFSHVCLCVCVSVCVSVCSAYNFWTPSHKNFIFAMQVPYMSWIRHMPQLTHSPFAADLRNFLQLIYGTFLPLQLRCSTNFFQLVYKEISLVYLMLFY